MNITYYLTPFWQLFSYITIMYMRFWNVYCEVYFYFLAIILYYWTLDCQFSCHFDRKSSKGALLTNKREAQTTSVAIWSNHRISNFTPIELVNNHWCSNFVHLSSQLEVFCYDEAIKVEDLVHCNLEHGNYLLYSHWLPDFITSFTPTWRFCTRWSSESGELGN